MLRELQVRNLALIESLRIPFSSGLTVVTGATGAGKSIVVDSLMLLSGTRANAELIRTGSESMSVTGVFDTPTDRQVVQLLEEKGIDRLDETVVRREVSREGRNRVYVNDTAVTLSLLSQLAPHLIRVHTQREELELAQADMQRQWVDGFGGPDLAKVAAETREAYGRFSLLEQRLDSLLADERSRLERIDLLSFQVREIEAAAIEPDEEVTLRERREVLRHLDGIRAALAASVDGLYESELAAGSRIASARSALQQIAPLMPEVAMWLEDLEDARLRVEEVGRATSAALAQVDSDPGELDRIESRLAELERLFHKYGASTQEVVSAGQRAAEELDQILGDAENREQLEEQRHAAVSDYQAACLRLSRARKKAGAALAKAVKVELTDLAMAEADISVQLEARSDNLVDTENGQLAMTAEGADRVILMLAANPGEPPGPLAKVASGGELSRIFLALQLVAQSEDAVEQVVLVFDEVDAGVGGAQAQALGTKLRRLATKRQLLAVTHLPQVASAGHSHLLVSKSSDQRTRVRASALSAQERVEEVARMLAGQKVTKTSLTHASDLLRQAAL